MSKIKMSFSLILALFLVGILSTAAFAKDPYGLKPVQVQGTLDLLVNFTGNTAAGDTDATKFDLHVYDSSSVEVGTPYTNLAIASNKGSQTISGLTPGAVYTIKLFHAGDDSTTVTALSITTGLVTDAHNTLSTTVVDKDGSGLINANQTGYNNTRKQRSGQKVHGFYQNNTNSCASCHQTHTGADTNLLFKDGTYSTCAACHDGTMGAYGVWNPITSSNVSSISGTFSTQAGHNGSLHEADGTLKVSAAPGGNRTALDTNAQWGQDFDCASCHAPHGNGSGSENNLNLDPLGWGSVEYKTTDNDTKNGKLFKNLTIQTSVPASFVTPYILVKTNATAADVTVVADKTKYKFQWQRAGVLAGDSVIQTYRWNNGKGYVADYSLWLQEKGYPYKADTILYNGTTDITRATDMKVVWRDGFAFGTGTANVTSATISVGVDVETTDDIATLFDKANLAYIPDSGVQMSKYCSACHTDYLSATHSDDNTGLYTSAHRHQTASDTLTCVRCHFGHGSDAQIMKDANDNSYYTLTAAGATFDASVAGNTDKAISYLLDPNPSSALKRYTGMSVCYACHGQGAQFLSNPNNNPNPLNIIGNGGLYSNQPGTVRGASFR